MAGKGERAYAYAKACGIVGKSFLGPRRERLATISRPADLDRLLFPDDPLELPERELSARLERRIADRAASHILRIVSSFSRPVPALVRLVRSYEYADLKSALGASAAGDRAPPTPMDIGPFGTIRWDGYPDIPAMLFGTEFDWIRAAPAVDSLVEMQTALDLHYYRALWRDVLSLPRRDRSGFESLVAEEIELKNVVWAMRLRSYYGVPAEGLDARLVAVSRNGESLAAAALECASFALDRRADWRGWKFERLIGPDSGGDSWILDPRRVQNSAARLLYRKARRLFRQRPFASDSIACFVKLMQFEEDILTSVAEGLALGLGARETLAMLEASA